MRKFWICLFLLFLPVAVWAQTAAEISEQVDDDRGFLTRLLERNLSGAGREVVIEGFQGALSSRATFRQITIADEDGVWLTLRDGAIQWTRSALLRGRIEIAELSANEILVPRLPATEDAGPQAETREFALPDLPVAVNIERIDAARVDLGEPVIGLPASISLGGSMNLDGGEGHAQLTIQRVDGPRGEFVLDTSYSNETRVLDLNLTLDEAADGLLVNLIDLYDKPAVSAEITGEGPLNGFAADIRLATDGQPRITGSVSATAEADASGAPGTAFRLEIGGDVASLLPPDDRAFFGSQTSLRAEGWRGETGRLEVPVLQLTTDALSIEGEFATNDRNAPQRAQLLMTLGRDAGATQVPVPLPFGEDTTVESGRLELQYDAAQGQGWTLAGRIGELDQGDLSFGELILDGAGEVALTEGALDSVTGQIEFGTRGMEFADPGMAQAVGEAITGVTRFNFTPGNALELSEVTVDGSDYGMSGYVLMSGLSGGITVSAYMDARYEDLTRLSTLADRPVTGRADAELTGYYVVLSREFDVDLQVNGTDISVGQEQLDGLLAGQSTIRLDARRDSTGIELTELAVDGERLDLQAEGYLNSNASDVTARVALTDLADAGEDFGGALSANAHLTGPSGSRRLEVTGEATDLQIGIAEVDGALQGQTRLRAVANETPDGYALETFSLANPQLNAAGQGSFAPGALDAQAQLSVPDLGVLGRGWSGGFQAQAALTERDGTRFIDLTGSGQDLSLGQQNVDGALTGTTQLKLLAEERQGVITLRDARLTNDQVDAVAEGTYGEGVTDVIARLDIRSLASFGPGWRGSLDADAAFRETGDGSRRLEVTGLGRDLSFGQAQVDGALVGETRLAVRGIERDGVFTIEQAQVENPRLTAEATGTVGPAATDLSARLDAGDLRFLGNGIRGALNAQATVVDEGGQRRITATGSASGLSVGQPRVDPLLGGQTSFDLAASQSQAGISVQRLQVNNPQLQVSAQGDPASGVNVDARLADLRLLLPEFPGAATVTGTLRESGPNFVIDLNGNAPGPTQLSVSGTAARNFSTADLAITGSTDARIANPFLRTRSIEGPVTLDLRLNGAPSLEALSGQVRLQNGGLAEPGLGIRMEQLDVTAGLQGGRIQLDGSANISAGGRMTISGPVDLNARTLDIGVVLDNVVARDPNLYETLISGQVRLAGAMAGGPLLSGRIDLGETEFRIPSTGLGGAKAIPDINHVGDTRPVRATRAKAGLEPYPSEASRDAGMAAPPSTPPAAPPRLDLQINAPNRIFIRGRGVDAEMGGSLQVQGTTRNVIPIGHFELIRGRVDLLGKRFDLTEGLVELQGSMIPVVRLVAETDQDGITTRIIIDGEIRDPEITFESSPELPQEEVLSQLLFRRGLDNISPLQAAQLANAIAVLAGRGGEGIVGNLRNQVGLDDLDVGTDDDGNVQVRAGKYLSENLYTDVAVGDDGKSTINLNLDVTDTLRARGSVGSDGNSTLGIYFERDY
ncbi:translocation/assembly module TamB domain-containing protein [Paracoccus siganidrum]|uniref:DUF490 domain-containing protein n=1 Tax=Paracoccus siganidrum TaxID=1276757 RepID=A0A419ABS2_9RHOB|nr:translocation/assembly module TamB domain-containing protein [Paracoccus siganidrum]RJL21288.1 DUF490 domain-containing protein [Paracoccus siganidrum]RMC37068.1 DUF490 domain-containing protein [Paracoccus siganidrum]